MPHIVAEPCINCRHTNCVSVCPVNCFHEGRNSLVIDPKECIDCGLCVRECPVKAIFEDANLPSKWNEYIELNRKYASEWPVITHSRQPLPTADEFRLVDNKRELFDPAPGETASQ